MIVYYHGGCPDGWAAAFIAKMKHPEAELIPLSYGEVDVERMIVESAGKNVLMVDFALKTREAHDRLAASAKSFLVLDHHKSAKEVLEGASNAVFDMDRSGAGLTWDYLFGKNSEQLASFDGTHPPRPWWVNYTEDQDLWRFKLPASRQVNAWLNIQERTPERWTAINNREVTEPAEAARLGYAIQAYVEYMTKAAVKDLQEGIWLIEGRNYKTGIVNNGHIGTSEVGEAVYGAGYDIALMWREDGRGQIRFGLRSTTVDVGKLAAMFEGGGGHKNSAGFELGTAAGRDLIDWLLGRVIYVPPRCV